MPHNLFKSYGDEATGPQSSEAVSLQAALAADQGNFSEASRLLSEGVDRDKEAGMDGMGAEKASALAFIESIEGQKEQTRAWALEAVSLLATPEIVMQSSTLLARTGFIADARRIAARMPAGEGPAWEADRLRSRGELLAATGDYQAGHRRFGTSGAARTRYAPEEVSGTRLRAGGSSPIALASRTPESSTPRGWCGCCLNRNGRVSVFWPNNI